MQGANRKVVFPLGWSREPLLFDRSWLWGLETSGDEHVREALASLI